MRSSFCHAWIASVGLALLVAACGDDNGATAARATLLWQDAFDGGGAPGKAFDVANAVAACDGLVFAVGETAEGDEDFFHVRAYGAVDGALAWQQRIESGAGDEAREVVCADGIVVASGNLGEYGRYGAIEAYDAATGAPVWSHGIYDGDQNDVTGIVIDSGRLYVASRSTVVDGDVYETFLVRRAFDVRRGTMLWEDRNGVHAPWATAALGAGHGRVCTMTSDQGDADPVYSIRCLRSSDGSLAWHRRVGTFGRVESEKLVFLPGGDALVLATVDDGSTVLKAFASRDGTLFWIQELPGLSAVVALAASPGRVLVTGVEFVFESRSDGDVYERDILFVQGRDSATGALVWEDRVFDTQPRDLAVEGNRVIVGGVGWDAWLYETTRGHLLVYEPAAENPPERWMWDVAAADGRYFMAGAFFGDLDQTGDLDFAVRAYSYR